MIDRVTLKTGVMVLKIQF